MKQPRRVVRRRQSARAFYVMYTLYAAAGLVVALAFALVVLWVTR